MPWIWLVNVDSSEKRITESAFDKIIWSIGWFLDWTKYFLSSTGFPSGSDGNESTCNVEDLGSNPELGRSTGGEHGNPLQYSCLENPHGQRLLAGCSPWGHKESHMTEQLTQRNTHCSMWLWLKMNCILTNFQ